MPGRFPRSSKARKSKVSKRKIRRVAVFGSGTVREGSLAYRQAIRFGSALAKADLTVYHGGYGGVMEAVARGCRKVGGRNVGVTVRRSLRGVNAWADAEIKTPSWQARLFELIGMGEAYIFLDGATGTLNELFFVWEMANKKLHAKPIVVLGERLRALVKFLKKDSSLKIPANFHIVSSISSAVKFLAK